MDTKGAAGAAAAQEKANNKQKKSKHHHHHNDDTGKRDSHAREEETKKLAAAGEAAAEPAEDWDANRARVEALCMSGPNHVCADCGEPGTRWASVNHGVFVCIRCSGVHRSLGTHVSKVKSTNMDKWMAAEVALMEAMGNRRAKSVLEASLGSMQSPTANSPDAEVRSHIERKYVQRAFAVANLPEVLKKLYKQVGYGKYKRAAGPAGGTDGKGGAAGGAEEAGGSRKDARALREETMKAFYGEGAASNLARPKQRTTTTTTTTITTTTTAATGTAGAASTAANTPGKKGGEPTRPAGDGAPASHKGSRKSTKTIHGTFGVVNVDPEAYGERLATVLAAFGISTASGVTGTASTSADGGSRVDKQTKEAEKQTDDTVPEAATASFLVDTSAEEAASPAPAAPAAEIATPSMEGTSAEEVPTARSTDDTAAAPKTPSIEDLFSS